MSGAGPPLVVVALPEEGGVLRRRLGAPPPRGPGPPVASGHLRGVPVLLAVCGPGARKGRRDLSEVLARHRSTAVCITGLAGGLEAGLGLGDLVVPETLLVPASGRPLRPDPAWRAAFVRSAGGVGGELAQAPALLTSPGAKAAFRRRAGGRAVAVDLEAGALALEAAEHGLPWLVIKVVSDAAAEGLPSWLPEALGEGRAADRARIVLGALARPRRLPELARLALRMRRLAPRIADAAETALACRLQDVQLPGR